MLDLTVLYSKRWATLECKDSKQAPVRPNQAHYVEKHNTMSYSAFVYPENEEEIIDGLRTTFGTNRSSCIPKRK